MSLLKAINMFLWFDCFVFGLKLTTLLLKKRFYDILHLNANLCLDENENAYMNKYHHVSG